MYPPPLQISKYEHNVFHCCFPPFLSFLLYLSSPIWYHFSIFPLHPASISGLDCIENAADSCKVAADQGPLGSANSRFRV